MARLERGPDNGRMDTEKDAIESVESAITRVLHAEQEALADIEASEEEAKEIQRNARQAARAVLRRTGRRLSRLHNACAARTRELIDEIERSAGESAAAANPDDDERRLLDSVVRTLAEELTSRGGRRVHGDGNGD